MLANRTFAIYNKDEDGKLASASGASATKVPITLILSGCLGFSAAKAVEVDAPTIDYMFVARNHMAAFQGDRRVLRHFGSSITFVAFGPDTDDDKMTHDKMTPSKIIYPSNTYLVTVRVPSPSATTSKLVVSAFDDLHALVQASNCHIEVALTVESAKILQRHPDKR